MTEGYWESLSKEIERLLLQREVELREKTAALKTAREAIAFIEKQELWVQDGFGGGYYWCCCDASSEHPEPIPHRIDCKVGQAKATIDAALSKKGGGEGA